MSNKKRTLGQRIRSAHYGEASLWLLFLLAFVSGFDTDIGGGDAGPLLAGVAALAAIGVRVTRREADNADAE